MAGVIFRASWFSTKSSSAAGSFDPDEDIFLMYVHSSLPVFRFRGLPCPPLSLWEAVAHRFGLDRLSGAGCISGIST